MANFATLTLHSGECAQFATFIDAKQSANDYYQFQGEDSEETVICQCNDEKLEKVWEKVKGKWLRVRDSKELARINKQLFNND